MKSIIVLLKSPFLGNSNNLGLTNKHHWGYRGYPTYGPLVHWTLGEFKVLVPEKSGSHLIGQKGERVKLLCQAAAPGRGFCGQLGAWKKLGITMVNQQRSVFFARKMRI